MRLLAAGALICADAPLWAHEDGTVRHVVCTFERGVFVAATAITAGDATVAELRAEGRPVAMRRAPSGSGARCVLCATGYR